MTLDELLKQAFEETAEERAEQMLKAERMHRFSLSYKLWERKVLRDLRKSKRDKHWTLKKARYAVAAMLTSVSLIIGGTAYAAFRYGRYGFDDLQNYSKMFIEAHPSDKITLEEYYGLSEEEWELVEQDIVPFSSTLIYKRGNTKITFEQKIIQDGSIVNISTDRAKIEPVTLFEQDDGFIMDFGKESLLYWIYDGYLLYLYGNIDKGEMIKLAYSTKIIGF